MKPLFIVLLLAGTAAADSTPCGKLAIDSNQLYFLEAGAIYAAPRAGGPSTLLAEHVATECIVADGTRVLFPTAGKIAAVPAAGGAVTTVAFITEPIGAVVLDGGELFMQTTGDWGGAEIHALAGKTLRTVAATKADVGTIVTDATSVYWTSDDGSIYAVAKSGGTPRVVTSGLDARTELAVDDGFIYYVADQTPMRAPKATTSKRGTKLAGALQVPMSMQLAGDRVYLATFRGVMSVGKTGGSVRRVSREESGALLADGKRLLWFDAGTVFRVDGGTAVKVASELDRKASPVTTQLAAVATLASKREMPIAVVALPDGRVLYIDSGEGDLGGGIYELANGKTRLLHKGLATNLAADTTDVFYVDFAGVWHLPLAGGKPVLVAKLPMPDEMALGLALDADHVYWTEHYAGTVRAMTRKTGQITTLATGLVGVASVVVDDANVYWSADTMMKMGNEIQPIAAIQRVNKQGGKPQTVVAGGRVVDLVIEGDRIHWLTDHGRVMTAKSDGSGARSLGVLAGAPQSIASAGGQLYITDSVNGTLSRVTPATGAIAIVYRGARTYGIAATGGTIVWTDLGATVWQGKILRLP